MTEATDYFHDPNGAAADRVVCNGDLLVITLPAPLIVPELAAPIPLNGTGIRHGAMDGVIACVQGDEVPYAVRHPLTYTSPPFYTPGHVMLSITLNPDNIGMHQVDGHNVLLRGSQFHVTLTVAHPAMQEYETQLMPDPVLVKFGTGYFMTHTYL